MKRLLAAILTATLAACGSGVYPGQDAIDDGMAGPAQCCYPQPCECPKLPG